jgi:hypothetical protein
MSFQVEPPNPANSAMNGFLNALDQRRGVAGRDRSATHQYTLMRFAQIVCELLAATSFVVGCQNASSRQSHPNAGESAQAPGPIQNRLSAGDTVLVSLDSNMVIEPVTLTRQIDNDGAISIWNSMRFVAIGLTPDELAAQIRYALITNWFHVRGLSVGRVQPTE